MLLAACAVGLLVTAGCASSGGGSGSTSAQGSGGGTAPESSSNQVGGSITVAMHYPSPPKSMLDDFTKQTGIKVKWVQIGWDDLQTKIATAASSNSYFADAADVDWSKVGQYEKTGWFTPLKKWFDPDSLKEDMPQIQTFMSHGELLGMPFDASFITTTINSKDFDDAGVSTIPSTLDEFTSALQKIKGMPHPLDIHFAAAEGLSTCWYQMTGAFGGKVLDKDNKPLFTSPDSAGYKAIEWMVKAYKDGLVPEGNINIADYKGFTTQMAKNRVAAVLCDYSGSVGSIYDVPDSSSVVNQVKYVPTPGETKAGPNIANPDGIGIPATAKNPDAAAAFIKWFTSTENQAAWAGANGPDDVIEGFPLPARVSSLKTLSKSGKLPQASELAKLLSKSETPFEQGAPPWYSSFSNAVFTNIHQAAAGQESVKEAVKKIAAATH